MMLLRRLLGDALRRQRVHQERTLRDVSADARVSLGYLSEVERGQKEASSELLASICEALGVNLSQVLREVSDEMASHELASGVSIPALVPVSAGTVAEAEAQLRAEIDEAETNVVGMSSDVASAAKPSHEVVAAA
ncbi:MAG: helix-turn-helix domain-containing protein [Acidothermaceae bacterium]